jgi:hypothetical protein
MKKFFIVLGSIFLALIVLGGIGIAFVAVRGNALDKESKAYADAAIPAIVTTWTDKALLDRASPEFNQGTTAVQVYHMFRWWEGSLGRLQKCEPAQGQSLMSVTTQSGKTISAQYTARPNSKKEKQLLNSFSSSMVISGRSTDSKSPLLSSFRPPR